MIVETSDNRFYRVTETDDANLAHVWFGKPVKRSKGAWVDKYPPARRAELVRKEASRIVEAQ